MVSFTKSWPFEHKCWVFSNLTPEVRLSPLCISSHCHTGQQRLPGNKSPTTDSHGGRGRVTQVTSPVEFVDVLSLGCRLCNPTTPTSIHYPSIPPSLNVFTPLRIIIPPDSMTLEPPQCGCGWNTFPLTIFHLLPVRPTIATVTEAYLFLSAPRSDTSSQWLWCFCSNEVTAVAKWVVA